jgi:hypothetical protein
MNSAGGRASTGQREPTTGLQPVPLAVERQVVNFQEVVDSVRTGNADFAKHSGSPEDRMDVHEDAPLTPKGREQMVRPVVEGRMTKTAAARRFNTTSKTAVRRAAVKLALDGRLVIYRKGKPVDPADFKGVYRVGLPHLE